MSRQQMFDVVNLARWVNSNGHVLTQALRAQARHERYLAVEVSRMDGPEARGVRLDYEENAKRIETVATNLETMLDVVGPDAMDALHNLIRSGQ